MSPNEAIRSLQALGFAMLFGPQLTMASPTPNEFGECKAVASAALTYCIDARGVTSPEVTQCWPQSERAFNACRGRIQDEHSPRSRRAHEAAAQAEAARAEAERRRQQGLEKPGQ